MKTEDLIKDLAGTLSPVKKQSSPNAFAIKNVLILFAIIIIAILGLRLRRDFREEIVGLRFVIDGALNLLVLLSGVFLTGWFSTAGRVKNYRYKIIMIGLFMIILLFNAYRLSLATIYFKNISYNIFDMKCFAIAMILSLFSMFAVGMSVSKRIVLRPGLVGAIIGLLSFSVGSFVIGIHCSITLEEHVTMYHTLLPMIIGTVVGYFSGKKFLKF